MIRKYIQGAAVGAALTLVMAGGAGAAASFPDLQGHWANATVQWGVEAGAVNGYPDGTFKPDNTVTEAEFLAMLIKAYQPDGLQKPEEERHWSDQYYNFAVQYNYPVEGKSGSAPKDQAIKRVKVAELLAGANGVNYSGDLAIRYVITEQISLGKVHGELSIESFKGGDTLTRAEAVQFIRNMKEKVETLQFRPTTPSPEEDLLEIRENELIVIDSIEKQLEKEVLPSYAGYTLSNNGSGIVTVKDPEGTAAVVIVYDAAIDNRLKQILVEDTRKDEFLALMVDVFQMFDIPVEDSFAATVRAADESGTTTELKAGAATLEVQPSARLRYKVGVHISGV
ncbi:S-layer homology domain-containing protein [Paenibacillus turpanensis]|uniref:S-layer homology domain-containing protein n=1 Tax=Paenibacillus turpanensis TaxID=2689078 RepID=UPI00140E79E7|nr:S-layer homology domain-containing protein [Paenibacillus turpanensis]